MIEWIIIGVFVVLFFMFAKLGHTERRIRFLVILVIGLLIYFSMVGFLNQGSFDFSSPQTIIGSLGSYFSWLSSIFVDLWAIGGETVTTVGNVIRMNSTG